MEIKTGKANSEPESPAVEVPPDRGRPARKKIAQKPQRGKSLTTRLIALARALALVVLCVVAAITAFSVYRYVWSTALLTLRTVRVDGCRHADAGRIEAITRNGFPSNILRVDLEGLRARLEQEPWVRRVEIRRILPATLVVNVQERVPAIIADIGGNLVLLDNEGILLDHYDTAYGKLDGPVFSGLRGEDAAAYKAFQEDNSSRVRTGIQVLAELEAGSPDFTRAVSEIDLSDPANIKVLLVDDAAQVYLGDHDFSKRFGMFMSNLNDYRNQKAQGADIVAVDLRFEGQITYRLRFPVTDTENAKSKVSRIP